MRLFSGSQGGHEQTPIEAALQGAVAGFAASLLLSALARILPGMDMDPKLGQKQASSPPPPEDPFNPRQVQEWQARSQSPAAYQVITEQEQEERGSAPAVTPAGALTQPQSPGPEGLAEQFSFKVASGVFDRDITPYIRPVGMATHLTYGSLWGTLYGLLQSSYRTPPALFGPLYGLVVWAVGPALLVPAMKLMRPPSEEPPLRTAMMIAGHIAYGTALAEIVEQWERKR
jgi:hypothetical protein